MNILLKNFKNKQCLHYPPKKFDVTFKERGALGNCSSIRLRWQTYFHASTRHTSLSLYLKDRLVSRRNTKEFLVSPEKRRRGRFFWGGIFARPHLRHILIILWRVSIPDVHTYVWGPGASYLRISAAVTLNCTWARLPAKNKRLFIFPTALDHITCENVLFVCVSSPFEGIFIFTL